MCTWCWLPKFAEGLSRPPSWNVLISPLIIVRNLGGEDCAPRQSLQCPAGTYWLKKNLEISNCEKSHFNYFKDHTGITGAKNHKQFLWHRITDDMEGDVWRTGVPPTSSCYQFYFAPMTGQTKGAHPWPNFNINLYFAVRSFFHCKITICYIRLA